MKSLERLSGVTSLHEGKIVLGFASKVFENAWLSWADSVTLRMLKLSFKKECFHPFGTRFGFEKTP